MGVRIRPRSRRGLVVVQHHQPMRRWVAVAGGAAGAGVVAEYLLDPHRGRSRRVKVRDKMGRAARKLRAGVGVLVRDVANRSRGVVAGTRYRFAGSHVDDKRVLHERVRSELGRHVRHPHAVGVQVEGDVVTLTGDVLSNEEKRALGAVRRVPGVSQVETNWTVRANTTGVSALQGEGRPREPVTELLQQHWSPTARMLVGLGAVTAWGGTRWLPPSLAWPLRGASVVLAARATTNLPLKRLTGVKAGRRAIDVEDTIMVAAPADMVWPSVSDYGLFRLIMPDVRELERSPDGRYSRWVISGPAGVPVRFDAEETRREEGREVAWKTIDGQLIAHAGAIRLDPQDGRTRLQVRLSYNPVAGAVGHAVAALFRADPKHKLHRDLQRLKSRLETEMPSHDAQPKH